MINIHPVAAFTDNYIWLIESMGTGRVMIVDPGDAEPVVKVLQQNKWTVAAILITHHHADHTGAINKLLQHYDCAVYGPAEEDIGGVTHPVAAASSISLDADFPDFTIVDTPGHTPGHISYLVEGCLFCGDTLFAAGCGRLLGGTASQLHDSLTQLASLPATTRIFCAHEYTLNNLKFALAVEPTNIDIQQRIKDTEKLRAAHLPSLPSTMAIELLTNPFLRCEQPTVIAAAEKQNGQRLTSPLAVFTTLRKWKDQF